MALVAVRTDVSPDTRSMQHSSEFGAFPMDTGGTLVAGEALLACAPCYIKASDGKVYNADGTAANEKAVVAGWTAKAYASGAKVSLFGEGVLIHYSDGALVNPGSKLYLATTPGRLDTAAQTGDSVGVAQVLNAYWIRTTRSI